MKAWPFFIGLAGTAVLMILAVGVYYAVSLLVLTVTGRLLPLRGRRRRRD
jgi:hypothetical protein